MFCPITRTTSDSELGKTISEFGIALLQQMDFDAGNIFFSPASIAISLGMVLAGAGGDTRKQMLDVLKCGRSETCTHKAFTRLNNAMDAAGESYKMYTANRLYSIKDFEISRRFTKILDNKYCSNFKQVDFTDPAIRSEINKWVAGETQEKVRNIIPEGLLSDLTQLEIVNAVYFKGKWSDWLPKPFIGRFQISAHRSTPVDMMRTTTFYLYTENEMYQAIQLPYQDDFLCMVIILPKENVQLSHVVRQLNGHTYLKLITSMKPKNVMVYLPKFSMVASHSLSPQLARLGLDDLFSPTPNLTRMTTDPVKLCVSEFIHKAVIKVTGGATFGYAATALAGMELGLSASCHDRLMFNADHPFMFSVYHRQLKCPLFYGALIQPNEIVEKY